MSGGIAIRGSRIGASSTVEPERGELVARQHVAYYCSNGHVWRPSFAIGARHPDFWDCPRCGMPASRDPDQLPPTQRSEPYKSHLAYVQERRSAEEGDALVEEALQKLRERRGE